MSVLTPTQQVLGWGKGQGAPAVLATNQPANGWGNRQSFLQGLREQVCLLGWRASVL